MLRLLKLWMLAVAMSMISTNAFAVCGPLVTITSPSAGKAMPLNGCQVRIDQSRTADSNLLSFKLGEISAKIWREELRRDSIFGDDLSMAKAEAGGADGGSSLPRGALVYARHLHPGEDPGPSGLWKWDPTRGTLTLQIRFPVEVSSDTSCQAFADAALELWQGEREVIAGELVAPIVYAVTGHRRLQAIPFECVSNWAVAARVPAGLPIPGAGVVAVSEDATPGQVINVTATVGGRTVGGRLRVVTSREASPVGIWRPVTPIVCGGSSQEPAYTVRELRLDQGNRFSFSWESAGQAAETSGTYRRAPELELSKLGVWELRALSAGRKFATLGLLRITDDGLLEILGWAPERIQPGRDIPKLCHTAFGQ